MTNEALIKGVIGLIVFLAASGAALLQLQLRHKIPVLFPGKPPSLLRWHRWLGRTALVAFLVNAVVPLFLGLYPQMFRTPRYGWHIGLAGLSLVLFAVKLLGTRRHVLWVARRYTWIGMGLWAAQAALFGIVTVHALARFGSLGG